ncbi:phosphate ABC transporter substrate-binding protein PstS [Leptolyngbya sp. NK1-12]|nr:phosphate ABC transporter substrate-binding protein PstS [Leptolyngbya sp. NK1-12]
MTSLTRFKRRAFIAAIGCVSMGLAVSCGPSNPDVSAPTATSPTAGGGGGGGTVSLSGAGASFPAPLYQRWFADYNKQNPNTQISYQSVGSGAGVEQFLAGTVDFGATDAPLKAEEREKFKAKFGAEPIQVPMTGGSVVFAYNLDGVDGLKLSRDAYCGIVTGEITRWNDPAIAAENSGVNLPDSNIQFVHRSDGSGTTFAFTNHLQAACPNWTAGANKAVEWPVGTGAKGNEGVTAQIQQTPGAIGYTEFSYAKENGLQMAAIENKAGNIVEPTPEAGALAFKGETVPADFALLVPDPENPDAYPISTLTWLLLYPEYQDAAKKEALNSVVGWSLTDGKSAANDLGYIPLETELADKVKTEVAKIQ